MTARATYVEAGAAARACIRRACADPSFTLREARVLLGVVALTTTYSRLGDHVFIKQLASFAYGTDDPPDWQRRMTRKTLKRLADRGIVAVDKPAGRAGYDISLVTDDLETWVQPEPTSRNGHGSKSDPNMGPSRTPPGVQTRPHNGSKSDPNNGSKLNPQPRSTEEVPQGTFRGASLRSDAVEALRSRLRAVAAPDVGDEDLTDYAALIDELVASCTGDILGRALDNVDSPASLDDINTAIHDVFTRIADDPNDELWPDLVDRDLEYVLTAPLANALARASTQPLEDVAGEAAAMAEQLQAQLPPLIIGQVIELVRSEGIFSPLKARPAIDALCFEARLPRPMIEVETPLTRAISATQATLRSKRASA
jgi:hypothetical protein